MCSGFTDEDVGKRVETAAGEPIGVVTMIGEGTAYVDLEEGVMDSIKAVLEWNGDTERVVPVGKGAVREVTGETVRLEGDDATPSTDRGSDPVFDRDETDEHDLERTSQGSADAQGADATEDVERAVEGEGRSGKGGEPETDDMTEAGAERHPDSEDRPPQGDRTVTKDRGENEDR